MFGNGHQLNVGEALFLDIIDQLHCQLPIANEFAFAIAPPGTGMYFVDGKRFMQPIAFLTAFNPLLVAPEKIVFGDGDGCSLGAQFKTLAVGIDFEVDSAVLAVAYLEFVVYARGDSRDEQFPNAAATADAHGMAAAVPVVEVAHDTHPLGIGCPSGE